MADDLKTHLGDDKPCDVKSLDEGAVLYRDLTPEEDRRILRKIDRW